MSTINDNKILKQEILNIVSKQNKRPIPIGILFSKITKQNSNKKHHNFNDFRSLIDGMITNGELKKTFSGAVVLGYENAPIDENNIKEGTIKINNKKIGFISLPNNRKSEYYVHTMNLNNAQDGDIVKFAPLLKDKQKNLKDAKVIEVIRHGKNFFVGIIKFDQNRNYQITLDDDRNYLIIKLNNTNGLVTGHKILIEIQKYEKDIGYGYVKKIIGHTSDVGVDILSIVYDNGVEPDFSEELLNETNNIKLDINSEERKIRKDLTNLNIFTIDPKTSKDFDDAIYVEKHEDIYKLYVSIADVSHYVSFNSVLDQEAYKRGCSIYLVDRVIPMLPHNLSDDICSLNPNVERLTLTCEMDINHNGEFKDIKIYPSIIKSKRRFNYDEVNEFFDKKNTFEKDTNEIKDCLLTALELHKILNVYRKKQGYIEFEIPEPVILVNEKCEPVKIDKRTSGTAQKLIENCMVAANEAVTIYAIKHKLPFVYRVHDKPNEERIKSFAIEAKKLNFHINTKIEDIEPKTISNWLINNKDNKNLDLINLLLLRSMSKAEYAVDNLGHFGLGSQNYTHFTSPIRRYPDLLVHRIFWMYLFNRHNDKKNEFSASLKKCCDQSSKCELIAIKCERDVNAMKFAEYMERHIGDEFDGFVTSVSPYAVFVQLSNTVEGIIKIEDLKNDYYVFNEQTNELIGRRTNLKFTLGTKVRVKVIAANKLLRKINFELVRHLGNR